MKKHHWMLVPLIVLFVLVYLLPSEKVDQNTKHAELKAGVIHQRSNPNNGTASESALNQNHPRTIKPRDNLQQLTRINEQLSGLNETRLKTNLSGFSETTADLEAYYDEACWLTFYLSLGYNEDDIAAMIALRSQSMSDEYQQTASDPDPSIPPHSILVEMLASNVIAYFRDEAGLTFQEVIDFSVQDIHQSYSVPNGTILDFAHLYLIDELERRLKNYAVDEQEVQFDESSSALTRQFVAYLDSDDEYIHQAKDPVVFSETNFVEQEYDVESETIE
ncbi:hypothetical protein JCM19239_448 [Vibrio variabilis]|uniref:Chromosome segregation ATPase n=1 Tax=Vibrio variabilis TaxID=990271 RepID=A0ABQ0JIT7_9VIBR|nr:hypothetical protein JCM19239_448 [Vibrio variabilis]